MAPEVVLFYHLTTHVGTDKDQELLGFLSDRVAFPTVLYMTHEGDVLHKHVGDRTTRSFQKEIHGYYQLHLARKDLAAGRSEARIKILENQLKLGLLSHEAALKSYLALDPKLLSSSLLPASSRSRVLGGGVARVSGTVLIVSGVACS